MRVTSKMAPENSGEARPHICPVISGYTEVIAKYPLVEVGPP